ncbi:MAG: tryptophan-rich sensory protein [Candidatus Peribacteraceae bacterium]|nr:tryptophan-rich sensory protein [Candidatus Peribacteraceae bacterium]
MFSYLIIPLLAFVTATVGGFFTNVGLDSWYLALPKPAWTPPGGVIGSVWTVLYILATISALIVWNNIRRVSAHAERTKKRDARFWWIIAVFVLNAFLNAFWSYVFFYRHWLGAAIIEAAALGLSVVVLMVLIWPRSKTASLLLLPYALWVGFATYLTYSVWILN